MHPKELAKRTYYMYHFARPWDKASSASKAKFMDGARRFLVARRFFRHRVGMITEEMYRIQWHKLSDKEKMDKIDFVSHMLYAYNYKK